MTQRTARFIPTQDGSFQATIGEYDCVISPAEYEDTWTVSVERITIVKATDDLEHAMRSCVTFANGLAGGMS